MKTTHLDLSVSRYNRYEGSLTKLYEGISTFEEAHLLALYEMDNNRAGEIVVILPGWNLKVDDNTVKRQIELAEKYMVNADQKGVEMNHETALQIAERNLNREAKKLQFSYTRKGVTESERANIERNHAYAKYVYDLLSKRG